MEDDIIDPKGAEEMAIVIGIRSHANLSRTRDEILSTRRGDPLDERSDEGWKADHRHRSRITQTPDYLPGVILSYHVEIMKYEIILWKTIRDTIHVEAATPEQAITDARQSHPGMNADEATELIPDADGELEPGASFVVMSACENCDKLIFDAEDYVHCEDCDLCTKCFNETQLGGNPDDV